MKYENRKFLLLVYFNTSVLMFLFIAEEKRKQEFFKARGLLKEQKEGTELSC